MNKEVKELIAARVKKWFTPLVYLVEEGSEDFDEDMKSGTLNDVVTLQEYIMDNIDPLDRATLKNPKYFYEVTFEKPGGIPMPSIAEYTYSDGSKGTHYYPAQIWRKERPVGR